MNSRGQRNVHVSVWNGEAHTSDVSVLQQELELLVREQAPPVGILLVVESLAPLAHAAARQRAVKMMRELGSGIGAVALVIEGDGFKPTAMRNLFMSLSFAIQPGFPWRMFSGVSAASVWLTQAFETQVRGYDLDRVVEELRGRSDHDAQVG